MKNVSQQGKKEESIQEKSAFNTIERNTDAYCLDIESHIPHIQQILFDLQNEYYKAWKSTIKTNILLQKQFSENLGLKQDISENSWKILEDIHEEMKKSRTMNYKLIVSVIEINKKNIKTWNQNLDSFSEFNKKTTEFWTSLLNTKLENKSTK